MLTKNRDNLLFRDHSCRRNFFFSKDEFISTLKGKTVDDDCYENTKKKMFISLKMRNLSDLNDLYNAQDVIILLEMIENRFQSMQDKTC